MRELTADRAEGGVLVCFDEDGALVCLDGNGGRLDLARGGIRRVEGAHVLLFDAIGKGTPYVAVSGAFALSGGRRALIFEPDEAQTASVRAKFDKFFGKRT